MKVTIYRKLGDKTQKTEDETQKLGGETQKQIGKSRSWVLRLIKAVIR